MLAILYLHISIMNYDELLNQEQLKAVKHNKGPLLILAGAGSGKTRVLTYRIAYLIEHYGVNPYNILALTFTNKAAGEMKERVNNIVGNGADYIWVSTFHSACVRILRRYISSLGYTTSFTIYDSSDQKTLIKEVCKSLDIDTKRYKEASLLNFISSAKDKLKTPDDMLLEANADFTIKTQARVYAEYQKRLKKNNALDFDDLIFKTVELFRTNMEALSYYRNRFKYIMVDEYQDTNHAQFVLISQLAESINEYGEIEHNLCVVGDDDQSIYRFRGADIYNILEFENKFPDTTIIKLEQNYRSTKNILAVANEVIHNNTYRKSKSLWTDNEEGNIVSFTSFRNSRDEAEKIVLEIRSFNKNDGASFNDFAILYRTNAQSRLFEEKLVQYGIPYKLIGGTNFYSRKEIKDIIAYLHVINNSQDDIQVKRIINVPKRGIGPTTVNRISDYAIENDISFYNGVLHSKGIPGIGKAFEKLDRFAIMIETLKSHVDNPEYSIEDLVNELLDVTGYIIELEAEDTVESQSRIENIQEFIAKIITYETEHPDATLSNFLEEVSLVADIDNYDESDEKVILMTLHGSKGLEFPTVYLTGMEEGLFPSFRSIGSGDNDDIEEERRLCYVGITRAEKTLKLSAASERIVNGDYVCFSPSRFIREIPRYMLQMDSANNISAFESTHSIMKNPSSNTRGKDLLSDNPYIKKGLNTVSSLNNRTFDKAPSVINYTTGDTVVHAKFGAGIVTDMTPKDNDYMVTVQFENSGQKKMKASFARLIKQ